MIERNISVSAGRLATRQHASRPMIYAFFFLALSVVPLIFGGVQVPQAASSSPGKIAFVRDGDIWIMDPHGSGQNRLTDFGKSDRAPVLGWSNDGKELAFAVHPDELGFDVYTLKVGPNQAKGPKTARMIYSYRYSDPLPNFPINALSLSWVSASELVVLVRHSRGVEPVPFLVDASEQKDTTDSDIWDYSTHILKQDQVFSFEQVDELDATPVSLDAATNRIVYSVSDSGEKANDYPVSIIHSVSQTDLVVSDLSGNNPVRLTNTPEVDELEPRWSPDGRYVVYTASEYGTYTSISLYDVSKKRSTTLVQGIHEYNDHPTFSPDGKMIAYHSVGAGGEYPDQIRIINSDGSNPTKIADNASQPAWQPIFLPPPKIEYPNPRARTEQSKIKIRGMLDKETDRTRKGYYVTFYRNGKLIRSEGKEVTAKVKNNGTFEKQLHLPYGDNEISTALNWKGIAGSRSKTVLVVRPSRRAASFGSNYRKFLNWTDKDFTKDANYAKNLLSSAGFDAGAIHNASAKQALSSLSSNSVFHFAGHGNWNLLYFLDSAKHESMLKTDSDGRKASGSVEYTYINSDGGHNFTAVQLAVLQSCYAAWNIEESGNIMKAMVDSGVKTAVGFNSTIGVYEASAWDNLFWAYAIGEKMEVGDAAHKAAQDARHKNIFSFVNSKTMGGVSTANLVVKRKNGRERIHIYSAPPISEIYGVDTFRMPIGMLYSPIFKESENAG